MATSMDHNRRTSFKNLITALVDSAGDTTQREAIGRLLPRLDKYASDHLESADSRIEVRAHLSEAFLVALGPDAALRTLQQVVDEAEMVDDQQTRANALIEAATNAGALGGLGTELLERMEQQAAALEPSPAKAHLFAALCLAFNRSKDSKKAGKLAIRALNNAEKVIDPEGRVAALAAVATELRKIGATPDVSEALDRARAVADGMEDELARCRAFVTLSTALCKVGRGDEGLSTLSRVFGTAKQVVVEPASASVEKAVQEQPTVVLMEEEQSEPAPAPASEQAPEPKNGNGHLGEEQVGLDDSWDDPTRGVAFPSYSGLRRRRR